MVPRLRIMHSQLQGGIQTAGVQAPESVRNDAGTRSETGVSGCVGMDRDGCADGTTDPGKKF